jgi:hypothetical protein
MNKYMIVALIVVALAIYKKDGRLIAIPFLPP